MHTKNMIWILALIPALLMASQGDAGASKYLEMTGRETDFWPRLFNFVIFAGLLYYLIATPLKNYFASRKEAIAQRLKEIERLLQEAKERKKEAEAKLQESKDKAREIVEDSKKEAQLLAQKIAQAAEEEISNLERQLKEKMTLEEKKAVRSVVAEVLESNITPEDIPLDSEKVVAIIEKKVA